MWGIDTSDEEEEEEEGQKDKVGAVDDNAEPEVSQSAPSQSNKSKEE